MLTPKQVSRRSQKSAYSEVGDMSSVCLPCKGPVRIEAQYDDPWQTPVTGAYVRIEDMYGQAVVPGTPAGPTLLGLSNFGSEDGQDNVPSLRPQLGTFHHPQVKRGPVKIALVPDPSAQSEVDSVSKKIIASLDSFQAEMEAELLPWITTWNEKGILSIPEAYRNGTMKGLSEWWNGEKEFWSAVGDWISSAFDAAINTATEAVEDLWKWYDKLSLADKLNPIGALTRALALSLYEEAKDLWDRRNQIMDLVKGFVSGSIKAIESGLKALVSLPGEVGKTIGLLVDKSSEWVGALIEMLRETDVIEKVALTVFGIVMAMTPNLWAEAVGTIEGYLLPEILIAIIFAIIAAITEGAGAPLLVARLTSFVKKIKDALKAAGKIGPLLLKVFNKLDDIYKDIVKLVKALKRKIDEAVKSATDNVTRILRRSGKRVKPAIELPCFNKPKNVDMDAFMKQLQEQEAAINNSNISDLIRRRNLVKESGGTKALRDQAAQASARKAWIADTVKGLVDDGYSLDKAKTEALRQAASLDATHALDIVAGGDPSKISGLQNRSVNRSMGSQWRTRVGALDDALEKHRRKGGKLANVQLIPC